MSTLRTRVTVPVAILVALAMAPALTGCFGNPIEGIIEQATGGDVDLGGPGVPDGFPSEVPLIDGEVVYGMSVGNSDGNVWNVTVKVGGEGAIDDIRAQLEGAGFTENEAGIGSETAEGATAIYESDAYGVLVVVTKDGDGTYVANYSVTQKG